jgi:hypothetical protein
MELTGKCREDFEKWCYTENGNESLELIRLMDFYYLTDSMQYGVYVDFFDGVGVNLMIATFEGGFGYYIETLNMECELLTKTRIEARTAAIKKANQIYNKI